MINSADEEGSPGDAMEGRKKGREREKKEDREEEKEVCCVGNSRVY